MPKIFMEGALLCDRLCQASNLTTRDIAYRDLKRRRARTVVEGGPQGSLADYVPFYFGPRSPMLYAYKCGQVTNRPENQDEIIYFVTSVETVCRHGLPFVFSDGHPVAEPKAFYDDLAMLSQVDLSLMREQYWHDTKDDPDRKRRRQAEFLVWERVPLGIISYLATRTAQKLEDVAEIVREHAVQLRCIVRPRWYYD